MNPGVFFNNRVLGVFVGIVLPFVGQASVIEGNASAESVLGYQGGYLVANVGARLEPGAKDGDGFISLVRDGGKGGEDLFSGRVPLNAPKGMGIHDGVLYVADIDRIVGIHLADGKQVSELSFTAQGAGFLNDLAITEQGVLLVSATDQGRIYRVDLAQPEPTISALPIAALPGPNGLALYAGDSRLLVASFGAGERPGEVGSLDLRSNTYTVVPHVHGQFDGVALLDEETALVSDWGKFEPAAGSLKQVSLVSGDVRTIRSGLSGPADFTLHDGEYALPNMMDGSILVERLP